MPAKKLSQVIVVQKNNQLKYNFIGVPAGHGSESLIQSSDVESSSKSAATAIWDITSDTGGQLGQSFPKFEDFLYHHGDGIWRRNDSPSISDGGPDGSRENPSRDDHSRDEQHLEKLR